MINLNRVQFPAACGGTVHLVFLESAEIPQKNQSFWEHDA
jgi:hypothetical protein